jgi:hypothetical protein
MSDFTCSQKGIEQPITVGQIIQLHCQGTFPLSFNVENAQVTGLQDKYALKVLKFELRDPRTADLDLTSYRVGQQNFEKIQITDGQTQLEFPGMKFEVKSVLPPPEGATQAPKPFGPFGPITLAVPWVYWVIVFSVIGIAIMLFVWRWKKRKSRLEVLNQIRKRTTGPTPIVQFHRDLRILTKKAGVQDQQDELMIPAEVYLKELRETAETFWGQKFKLALLGQGSNRLEKEFKSYAPKIYIKYKAELKFWNKRWQRLNATSKQAQMKDFIDMTLETRNLIEKMVEEEL